MKDKPRLILAGDEWCHGSYADAVTSSDLAVENSFRKFFSVVNLAQPRQSPQESIELLETYLRGIDLRGLYPKSNITVVFVLGNTFRDINIPKTGVLDAHRRSVLNVLDRLGQLAKDNLPRCSVDKTQSKMGWYIVGGSTDIGGQLKNQIMETFEDMYLPDIISSWCQFVQSNYKASPFSHDPDRLLVKSQLEPSEVSSIKMLLHKHSQFDQLCEKGWLSSDYIPTEMMTDVLAEYIHKMAMMRFSEVSYIDSNGLHDEHSKQHYIKR